MTDDDRDTDGALVLARHALAEARRRAKATRLCDRPGNRRAYVKIARLAATVTALEREQQQ